MRATHRHIVLLIAIHYLSACSIFQTSPSSLDSRIDYWLSNNQFDRIDAALGRVDANNPDYRQVLARKPAIQKKKKRYINNIIDKGRLLKQQENWQEAINTYNGALRNIEEEPRIKKALHALISERNEHIEQLKNELLIRNAEALLSQDEAYDRMIQLMPDDGRISRDYKNHLNEKRDLAILLEECGKNSNRDNLLQMALSCYRFSNDLDPSEKKKYWVDKLNKQLTSQTNYKRYVELIAAYKSAYKDRQYDKAKKHLETLLAINPNHAKANEYLSALNSEIDSLVDIKIETGKELYSNKRVKAALDVWKQAYKLSPDNTELPLLINRAEKVSKNLKLLESNQ